MTDQDKDQSQGRQDNAAKARAPETSKVSPEDYPATRADDSVERTGRTEAVTGETRSFDNPVPRQGAGDSSATAAPDEGLRGPKGDPAEGKR